MFWTRLYQNFLARRRKQELTVQDFYAMDTNVEDENAYDREGLMIEDGEVVGETAFVTEHKQLQPTEGPLPAGVAAPSFESDKDIILEVASSICHIIVEFKETTEAKTGTAFFIDSKHLVTAGHCLERPGHTFKRVHAVSPGIPHINYTNLLKGKYPCLECTVIRTLYTGTYKTDIALLGVGTYRGTVAAQLSTDLPPVGSTVDVIGYPGDLKSPIWMKNKVDLLNDIDRSVATLQKLLPSRTIVTSRGTVRECTGTLIKYNLSTVPGMSGSCVLYQGKLIGTFTFIDLV